MPAAGSRVLASDTARHFVFATQSTAQTIATGTANFTEITMDAEVVDTDNMHDNVTNRARFVLGAGALGYWQVSGVVCWAAIASGAAGEGVRAGLGFNGALGPLTGSQIILPYFTGTNSLVSVVIPPIVIQITAVTDYVTLLGAHTNAASRNTLVSGGYRSSFTAVWLGA